MHGGREHQASKDQGRSQGSLAWANNTNILRCLTFYIVGVVEGTGASMIIIPIIVITNVLNIHLIITATVVTIIRSVVSTMLAKNQRKLVLHEYTRMYAVMSCQVCIETTRCMIDAHTLYTYACWADYTSVTCTCVRERNLLMLPAKSTLV